MLAPMGSPTSGGSDAPSSGSRTRRFCAAPARFLDDLDPVANTHHAAVLRAQVAHARITRLDPAAALDLPGVTGILTGADVAAMSKPFPAGVDSPIPYRRAAHEVCRYVGEPLAVVVARDRYVAEDALELIQVDYEPLEPVMDPLVAAADPGLLASDRSFRYGDPERAFANADLVVSERFSFPRWSGMPVECYAVVAEWDAAAGSLSAWANFQGPFTLHSVAAASLGLAGSKLRLVTPPDSGGSYGIKSTVYVYVVLMGLAAMKLGVPVRWIEDRLEHLGGSSGATARITEVEAAFTADGELTAVRYDVVEDVGAYVRAPEPATLYRMHGSLSGAYRVQHAAARNRIVLTNRCPTGLNRGFGGPQLYFALERTMAIAARRLELDPVRVIRRNLSAGRRVPVPDAVRRHLRLGRLRSVPRRRAAPRALRRAPGRAGTRSGRRTARRHRTGVRRRAVDLEHGLYHARAHGRRAGA